VSRVPWWAAVVAAVAVGAGVGAGVAAAGHVEYRAAAAVVVSAKGGPGTVRPFLPNLRELATSSLLAGNVDSTLRLPGSPDSLRKRLHASTPPDSQVIRLSVTDRKRDRARQIAQEAAVVFVQLVQSRFGTGTPALKAAILDPAHLVGHRGRHFVRDPLIGAAIGLVVALAALLATRRSVVVAAPRDATLAEREKQLKQRIDILTQRERALAKRAGELAKRERAVESREAEAHAAPPPLPPEPEPAPAPAPAREPEPEPVAPAPTPEPAPAAAFAMRRGGWNLTELERLVDANQEASPEVLEQQRMYLFFLRDHARTNGELPAQFDSLVEEVFGELVD
jgi:hypothetical protein